VRTPNGPAPTPGRGAVEPHGGSFAARTCPGRRGGHGRNPRSTLRRRSCTRR
jgi:hypothetical protein